MERLNGIGRPGTRFLPYLALAGYGVAGLLVAMQGLLQGVIFVLHDIFATLGLPFMFLFGMAGWGAQSDALGRLAIGPASHGAGLSALAFLIVVGAVLHVKALFSPERRRVCVALSLCPGIMICFLGGFSMACLMMPGLFYAMLTLFRPRA